MTVSLIPLPYTEDALAPHISAQTLQLHHGAHHKSYVTKTNEAIVGSDLADAGLNEIVLAANAANDTKLFNPAAQAWNHGFYWNSMSPDKTSPDDRLAAAIADAFGSHDEMAQALAKEAEAHFASGWAWLVADGGTLKIISTHDAATPLTGDANPLLTIDVWEHAYYLDAKNERPKYIKAVIENLLNWSFASENFARGSAWVYPS